MFCQMSLSKVFSAEFSPNSRGPLPRPGEGNEECRIIFRCHRMIRSCRMIVVTPSAHA